MNPEQPYNPNQPQPNQVVQPDYGSRTPVSAPFNPSQTPQVPVPTQPNSPVASGINDPEEEPKSKKGLIIGAIIGGSLILLLIIIAVIASSGDKNTKKPQQNANPTSTQTQAILPAQAVEVEQVNNSLSQDLSRLDDEKDLPNNSLTDATLGL